MTETPASQSSPPPEQLPWGITYLRENIQDLRQDLRENIQGVRQEMHQEIQSVRQEVHQGSTPSTAASTTPTGGSTIGTNSCSGGSIRALPGPSPP